MEAHGRAFLTDGRPAGRVVLSFYRVAFGGTGVLLGWSTTEPDGTFRLAFDAPATPVTVEIRAVTAGGREEIAVFEGSVGGDGEALALVVPADIVPREPEYTRLSADLARYLDGGRLGEAQERAGRRDVSMLSRSSRWDARLVALAAAAQSVAAATGIEEPAVYGMLRAGLPARTARLALASPAAVGLALRKAVQARVVALTPPQIEAAQAAFERFAVATRRDIVGPGALSSHGAMLAATQLSDGDQHRLDQILSRHRGTDEQLWSSVRGAGLPADRIELVARLGHLTGNNAPLVAALGTAVNAPAGLREMLIAQRLYRVDAWIALLEQLARTSGAPLDELIPPAYGAATTIERRDAYATHLANQVRVSYPTNVIADLVRTDELVLGAAHATVKDDVAAALDRASAPSLGYGLGRTPLNAFLRDHAEALFSGLPAERAAAASAHMKTLHRLYQITPNDEAMKVLLDHGLTSARAVTAMPYEKFLQRYGKKFPSTDDARRTFAKAQQGTAITYAFFGAAKQIAVSPPTHALSPAPTVVEEAKNNLIKHYPTLETLFGSLDFCECDHCRSVLSPAAYLVDILKAVDPDVLDWDQEVADWPAEHAGAPYPYSNVSEWEAAGKPSPISPYAALTSRRPDLAALPLTCENTNTALPYIDIVNEILEYSVVHGQLGVDAAYDTAAASTSELLAEPQHLLPAAYDVLRTASYPLPLPFDLWLETVRRFGEAFDTPLWKILDALAPTTELYPGPGQAYGAATVALERLGVGTAEVAILTRPDALAGWPTLYGYSVPEATALAALSNAKALSRRLDVSYHDLVALVRTGFVNPRLETLVTLRTLGIDTEDVLRYQGQDGSAPFSAQEKAAFEEQLGEESLAWVQEAWAAGDFGRILVLSDPDAGCGFETTTLCYADGSPADPMAFVLLNLFVRLRQRLGWSIDELDRALGVFLPATPEPRTATTLGPAMASALLGLAHLDLLTTLLKTGSKGRLQLLALWTPLDDRRYVELFLASGSPTHDAVFEHPLGQYLTHLFGGAYQPFGYDPALPEDAATGNVSLASHLGAVQAALQLSADEANLVLADAGIPAATAPLNLATISTLYRYGLLARLLRINVADLIGLKSVSGLDPFQAPGPGPITTLAQDHPHATVAFVEAVVAVKESGLSVPDLDFLLRHRFDPVGAHRSAAVPPLAFVRTLAAEMARIAAEHAEPADPLTMTDEVVRQKFALAFTPDVVETFLAMWTGTITYDTVRDGVVESDQLDPVSFTAVPAISVEYDPVRQEQHLRFRGVLTAPVRASVDAALPSGLPSMVGELLDAVQEQTSDFFLRHLLTAFVVGVGEVGFLEPADLDLLFPPVLASQDQERARRARFAETFLPYLRERLIRSLIVAQVAADLVGDASVVAVLLTNPALVDDPDVAGRELLASYAAIAVPGLTSSVTADGGIRLDGYLEVPVTGGYRFSVRGTDVGQVDLRFDHLTDPMIRLTTTPDNLEPSAHTELKAGVAYGVTLECGPTVGDIAFLIRGEQLTKGPVDRLVTYPRAAVSQLHRMHLLVAKSLFLVTTLGLSEGELRYLLTHRDDFDGLDLGALPTRVADDTPDRARALYAQLRRLLAYTDLRRDLGAAPEDLIAVFDHARRIFPADAVPADATDEVLGDLCGRLAEITRRDPSIVDQAAAILGLSATATAGPDGVEVVAAGFVDEQGVARVWSLLALVARLGVAPVALQRWATPEPDHAVARDVRDTLKARFTPDQWRRVVKPISDVLRQRRRDALVAHVMHTGGFASTGELFEYYLVDPGTEPIVQTSRLRLAISTVQLFVQRCLLGLEVRVHPSALNSAHWQWMKRYRVWEANRKIFLWPENWLEPEFRDDKTDFFGEFEGTLLQSDIANDSAEAALIVYLRSLERLARLDIRAIHLEERHDASSNTLHVLARTFTKPHKYYYRSYAQQMWTPWLPVTIDVAGDHATLAVWRGRVHVFWVDFLTKAEATKPTADDTKTTADVPINQLAGAKPRVRVQGGLSWTALFNGAWSEPASTGYIGLSNLTFPESFDPSGISAFAETDPAGPVWVRLHGTIYASFRLTSVHATPTMAGSYQPDTPYTGAVVIGSQAYNPWTDKAQPFYGPPGLAVNYAGELTTKGSSVISSEFKHTVILGQDAAGGYELVTHPGPLHGFPEGVGEIVAPFFYVDHDHMFFVEPKVTEQTIEQGNGLTLADDFAAAGLEDAGHWQQIHVLDQQPSGFGRAESISIGAKYSIEPQQDWLTTAGSVVELAGSPIDAAGGVLAEASSGASKVVLTTGDGDLAAAPFHQALGRVVTERTVRRDLSYQFFLHQHAYVSELVDALIQDSVRGLQAADTKYVLKADGTPVDLPAGGGPKPILYEEIFTKAKYAPTSAVKAPWPVKDIDFTSQGAYAVYNWELFYHVPLTVAIHLSRNGRFDEAQRWFHYVFDPTDSSAGPTPQRFWKVRAFHQSPVQLIEDILVNLSTGADEQLRLRTIQNIMAWKDKPFRPHLVARYRPTAYMFKAFTAYADNLIAWADSLFREDTGEAINEAAQLYILLANILGPRPQEAPNKGWQQAQTYGTLRPELDAFSNAMTEIEVDIPFDVPPHQGTVTDDSALATIRSIGSTLYFCVPRNDHLIGYWDTVADRLFKIRNSLNIQGVFRQLPLFEPPIDPALLARATAAGVDIGAVVAGLNQPLPLVRFGLLIAKANEIAAHVSALGNQLLSAIEKEDGEALAMLRARHEKAALGQAEVVRYEHWQHAVKSREAIEHTFAAAVRRYTYFERMLGRTEAEISVPGLEDLDAETLEAMGQNFSVAEPEVTPRDIAVDIASDLGASGGKLVSSFEAEELDALFKAQFLTNVAGAFDTVGAGLAAIPQFEAAAKPMGTGSAVEFGGQNLAAMMSATAALNRAFASVFSYGADLSARIGSYARREQEWAYQSNVVAGEISQIYKQWRAAQILEAIAEREWRNHQRLMLQAAEIEQFLTNDQTGKTTNRALYTWLRREVRGLYGQTFQFALDVARKAERAAQHELGEPNLTYLQTNNLSGRQALLAGERLLLDLGRMEMAYRDLNRREYELTRHVSLRQVDPLALLALRKTGSCALTLPEELFDLDCPGHYFRRLKTVAVSIPCVVGPYASVNCTLTLQKSSIRKSPTLGESEDPYARDGDDAERFSDYYGRVQSIVTSSGTDDSGLFETNLRDERYLPFEGSGAITEWQLELPTAVKQFDHDTISDVILHVRYTAREGGAPLRTAAETHLAARIAAADTIGSVRLLSLRHEFADEWVRFRGATPTDTGMVPLTIALRAEHYPYWAKGAPVALRRLELFVAKGTAPAVSVYDDAAATTKRFELAVDPSLGGLLRGGLPQPAPAPQTLPEPVGSVTWYLDDNTMADAWLALTWGAPE